MFALLACLALTAEPAGWEMREAATLTNIRQVTKDFVRAGEGYFSPDGTQIIFQAEEPDTNNPFYQIYVMNLDTGRYNRISPGVGKTTCSYFRPDGKKIIFASTHLDPEARNKQRAEFRRRVEEKGETRRYRWDFDPTMDIFESNPDGSELKRLTTARGYDAEGSYSPDGKKIVFCSNRDNEDTFELYIMDADGGNVRRLTHTKDCYNGGPFFSPDGKRVIFRSDRGKKDMLQLYVINADGAGERALTNDPNSVHWAPFWYKDSEHIIYTRADYSNPAAHNFDLWWMNVDTGKKTRITYSPAADILPAFNHDGTKLMWTSTRDAQKSSQLYIADFTPPKDR